MAMAQEGKCYNCGSAQQNPASPTCYNCGTCHYTDDKEEEEEEDREKVMDQVLGGEPWTLAGSPVEDADPRRWEEAEEVRSIVPVVAWDAVNGEEEVPLPIGVSQRGAAAVVDLPGAPRKRPASASPGAIRKRPAAEVAVHPAAPGAPMASGNRYSMEYYANHISWGFKDKTSKKQVMQVQAKKLSRATVESIAQKVHPI